MKKIAFCICENKGADQLLGNHAADLQLCFATYIIISLLIQNINPLAIFFGCTGWFVSETPKADFIMTRHKL